MKKLINQQDQSVTFTFENGLPSIIVAASSMNDETRVHAMLHGIAQKVGDSAAIPKTAENNYLVTEAMRHEQVAAMALQLETSWNAPTRAKAAPSAAALKAAIEVMVEMLGCTVAEATAMVTAKMNAA